MRRRVLHEVFADSRPMRVGLFAITLLAGWLLLPLARGVPGARGEVLPTGMLLIGGGLAVITLGWWIRIALDAIVQHLLILQRCGLCAHPAPDRGPHLPGEMPFAFRSWRCTECGSEWVASGAFPDAETRRDAA
jgi:hypothetical protein